MIIIDERLYSVAEVARISGHRPGYVRALIEQGVLEAVRVTGPDGSLSQWRIYPASLRKWLGVEDRTARRKPRKAQRERDDWRRLRGGSDPESALQSASTCQT